jgi:hypothetical protein
MFIAITSLIKLKLQKSEMKIIEKIPIVPDQVGN